MKKSAKFYHAGCPVCVDAESLILETIDRSKYDLEVINFAEGKNRLLEAEKAGVKSVPALVVGGNVFHINFGASLDDVKG